MIVTCEVGEEFLQDSSQSSSLESSFSDPESDWILNESARWEDSKTLGENIIQV